MIKATNLKCEYLADPLGIDITTPRLFWNAEGAVRQSAYRVVAYTDGTIVWDSGKVITSKMNTQFPGPFSARQRVTYTVTLWDGEDREGEPAGGCFEIGLLKAADWKAKWISGDYKPKKKTRYPVDCFSKKFTAKKIVKARLYATACGLYEIVLNGKRVGDFRLAPGHTDYTKRIQYQTYDVTGLVQTGENVITAELADGWYRGSCGAWGITNQYGTQTKLLIQLEMTDENGVVSVICTDKSWTWSNDGARRFADNKDGERVDSRLSPTYNGKAIEVKCDVLPTASNNVPVTEHETFTPTLIKTPKGQTVLDFGQNIAGYLSFRILAKNGQTLSLRFGEMFDKEGEFTQRNIQCVGKKKTSPLQRIDYICRDGLNEYKTKFAVFGFRYALAEGDVAINPADFTAIAVYSDIAETGKFDCSNPLVSDLVKCTQWSTKNNSLDIPTDCPTRERHGWTGDAQIFFPTASYLFDYAAFTGKYLHDMYDWQKKDGRLPQIAPYGGVDFYMATMNGSVGWSDAGIILPYGLWKKYGDRAILERYYERMQKYAQFMIKRIGKVTVLSKPLHLKHKDRKWAVNYGQSYGEWAEPAEVYPNKWTDMVFPHPEVSTAYTSYVMSLMAEIAGELGREADRQRYQKYADHTKEAYQAIRRTKEYPLDTDRQAMLVRPLCFGLLDEEGTAYAEERLVKALDNYGWRLGTGFLSTPLILDVLTKINVEYAYKLLENEQMPGWLFMPKMGATTIWESWEGTEAQGGIASLDHYSKGAACEWLFSTMCGIRIAGENKFVIAPQKGGNFTYAKASYQSIYGLVESGWKVSGEKTVYTVKIPCNCTAEVVLPCGTQTLTAGEYTFDV